MLSMQIDTLINRTDPAMSWKWVYGEENLPMGGPPYHYVEGCDLSFNNIAASQPIFINAGFIALPSTHTIAGISLTLYEDQEFITTKWILAWKSKIKNFSTGIYNPQNVYKQRMKFQLTDTKGNVKLTATYINAFPTETGNLSLNYTESGRLILTQQFWTDDVEIT